MKPVYKHPLLFVLTFAFIFSGSLFAQVLPTVDIGIFQASPTQLEVRIKPNFPSPPEPQSFAGLFSNLQYTIVWDASTGITLGQPTFQVPNNFYMYPVPASAFSDVGGKRYQKFAGFGFSTIAATGAPTWVPGDEIVISIIPVINPGNATNSIGSNWFSVGHDATTTDPSFNGTYYAELNAADQTGICYAALNALPVELMSFTAEKANEHDVNLKWVTATELNNDYFLIEKKKENGEFVQIAKVDGNGTTTEEVRYDYTDRSSMANINYYRLKQVDFDGTTDYSEVVEVRFDLFNNDKFVVYPSPAISHTTLEATGPLDGTYTYSVTDFHGRTLTAGKLEKDSEGKVRIDLSDYAEGVYYIRTVSPRAKSYLNRVIKINE